MLACTGLAMLTACSENVSVEESNVSGPVVLAASSLQEPLEQAADAFAGGGHPRPVLSFAVTSALARQIERGAPADMFIAADDVWMDRLEREKLLAPRSRRVLLTNELVVIAPMGWTAPGRDPFEGMGHIALADPQAVPAGRYARAALEQQGRWEELLPRIIPTRTVRAALIMTERKQVDRAIVYATAARASRKVEVIYRFPENSHPPIRYPAAVLAASRNEDAEAFLDFLGSIEGRAIFREHGFGIAK